MASAIFTLLSHALTEGDVQGSLDLFATALHKLTATPPLPVLSVLGGHVKGLTTIRTTAEVFLGLEQHLPLDTWLGFSSHPP